MKTGYIVGITRGHNAGVCLLKDGEIVFSIEEERLSRQKYDGGPFASIYKILAKFEEKNCRIFSSVLSTSLLGKYSNLFSSSFKISDFFIFLVSK